jgi:hypothetical protein
METKSDKQNENFVYFFSKSPFIRLRNPNQKKRKPLFWLFADFDFDGVLTKKGGKLKRGRDMVFESREG